MMGRVGAFGDAHEVPQRIALEGWKRLDSFTDEPTDEGSFADSIAQRLPLQGVVEVLLDHDLEPLHPSHDGRFVPHRQLPPDTRPRQSFFSGAKASMRCFSPTSSKATVARASVPTPFTLMTTPSP